MADPIFRGARVIRGAHLLTQHNPSWGARIDGTMLNMADPTRCILGQLYGHFSTGLSALGLSPQSAMTSGFIPFDGLDGLHLRLLWLKQVARSG